MRPCTQYRLLPSLGVHVGVERGLADADMAGHLSREATPDRPRAPSPRPLEHRTCTGISLCEPGSWDVVEAIAPFLIVLDNLEPLVLRCRGQLDPFRHTPL